MSSGISSVGNAIMQMMELSERRKQQQQQQERQDAFSQQQLDMEGQRLQMAKDLQPSQLAESAARTNKANADTSITTKDLAESGDVGLATTLRQLLSTPGLADSQKQNVLGQATPLLDKAGLLGAGGDVTGQSIADLLGALIKGRASGIAARTPGSAERMISPMNMRPGDAAFDPVMGNQLFENPAAEKTTSSPGFNLSPGQTHFVQDDDGKYVPAANLPDRETSSNAITPGEMVSFISKFSMPEDRQGEIGDTWTNLVHKLYQTSGGKNAPAMGKPTGKVIPDAKTGKKWLYKGNMTDPTKDANEANWKEVP